MSHPSEPVWRPLDVDTVGPDTYPPEFEDVWVWLERRNVRDEVVEAGVELAYVTEGREWCAGRSGHPLLGEDGSVTHWVPCVKPDPPEGCEPV